MKIISVVGARPNFIKIAAINHAIDKFNKTLEDNLIIHEICHTGQHYDKNMSDIFFDDLAIPQPAHYLGIGSYSHAEQTGRMMIEFEKVLLQSKPDLVLVVGDVNSTLACSITATKLGIKVAHVEAGLRSFDMTMPEEINRIVTDSISDYLFVTENSGIINLANEGVKNERVFFVGNVMIDSLVKILPKANQLKIAEVILGKNGVIPKYAVVTLHRPSNVDNPEYVAEFSELLTELSKKMNIIFPIHPRSRKNFGSKLLNNDSIKLVDPLGYLDFISLIKNAEFILTDSGGIQEESTYLMVPCVTIRDNTERPVTVELGTNYLAGTNLIKVKEIIDKLEAGNKKSGRIPELWDGAAGDRIVKILYNILK